MLVGRQDVSNLPARHPEAFDLPQVAFQISPKLGTGHQRLLRPFPGAIEHVLVRVRSKIVPFTDDALNQGLEVAVSQKLPGEEERPLALMLSQLIENNLPAFRKSVPGENNRQPSGRSRAANDPALPQLHVTPF